MIGQNSTNFALHDAQGLKLIGSDMKLKCPKCESTDVRIEITPRRGSPERGSIEFLAHCASIKSPCGAMFYIWYDTTLTKISGAF